MNTAQSHSRESGNPGSTNNHWIPACAGMTRLTRSRLVVVDVIAYVVLAFGIGLATAVTLAGVVLLLAQEAQAAEFMPMKPAQAQQGTLLLKSKGETLAVPAVATDAEIRAVLDWEGASVGDPMADLAWPCLRTWRFGEDAREQRVPVFEFQDLGRAVAVCRRHWHTPRAQARRLS